MFSVFFRVLGPFLAIFCRFWPNFAKFRHFFAFFGLRAPPKKIFPFSEHFPCAGLPLRANLTLEMLEKASGIDDLKSKSERKKTMKKILLALFVLAIAAAPGLAADGVSITWDTYWGAYTHDATDLTDLGGPFMLVNYAVTWQLIYAGTDDTANDPSTLTGGANGDYVTGDDVVWASRVFSVNNGNASDGTVWTTDLYYAGIGDRTYNDTTFLTSGDYIYQRIFEGTPTAGSYYYDSELEALQINPAVTQASFLDVAGGRTSGIQGDETFSAIPEPATMSLLGLGALVMAIRRRRS